MSDSVTVRDEVDQEVDQLSNGEDLLDEDEGSNKCLSSTNAAHQLVFSPSGSKFGIPNVHVDLKPKLGVFFQSVQQGISMYERYAQKGGFDVRLSTTVNGNHGIVKIKYVLCSKEGDPPKKSFDTVHDSIEGKNRRNSNTKKTGCRACIKLRFVPSKSLYEVYYFEEKHNHMLLDENEMSMCRKRRQLSLTDQVFIHNAASCNIGATKAHTLHMSLKGGFDVSGCTVDDYKNFRRDLNDGEMVISMLEDRSKDDSGFSFEYNRQDNQLCGIFWADEIAKLNYQEFGDVISFDATFRTNQYRMVFVPFTAINNHKKSITVGAALLSGETLDNFKWLLEAFFKAHCGKQPSLVLTDQCLAMKQAIPLVFTESRHRLCMWHIMAKVQNKVSTEIYRETHFIKRFNKLVWNVQLEPEEFETMWLDLISEFKLQKSKWFSYMFRIRQRWKTTSRSESINSFFNKFAHHGNNFVTFMLAFENAMRKQRNSQRKLDHATKTTVPHMCTPKAIEKHANEVYTRAMFLEVQKEIDKGAWSCVQQNVVEKDGCQLYTILQNDKCCKSKKLFKVVWNQLDSTFECECNHFSQHGFLCRHVFKVLMNENFNQIPEKYICRRWRRDLICFNLRHISWRQGDPNGEMARICYEAQASLDYILMSLRSDKKKLKEFAEKIHCLKAEVDANIPYQSNLEKKKETIRNLIGVNKPEKIDIQPPSGIRNKGCGTGKRLIGAGEKAAIKNQKAKRLCRNCQQLGNHDSRNCPLKNVND